MALEERQMLVGLLSKGMYVCRLDRDWVGTPFPLQGFTVQSDDDIELLSIYCTSVFIDTERGDNPGAPLLSIRPNSTFPKPGPAYEDSADILEELPRAREVHADVHSLASRLAADVRAGRRISPGEVREAMEPMVESLLRNVDAMFWLIGLMKRDEYAYSHAVNCSALATAFGRHLALPRDVLVELATGGFLLDIGKSAMDDSVFNHNRPLTPDGRLRMRGHVAEGLRVIEEAGIQGRWVHEMLAAHHESHDGSGYPHQLRGAKIPLGGRMAAVIDTYDALCSERPHSKGVSRHEALQTIYRASDRLYQGEVVEQFLQCLGVYPTGSLVELSTGQVGIVMVQNQARRLRPRVMLLLTADKQPYTPYRDIDLMAGNLEDDDPEAIKIVTPLEPGAYGLDPADLFLA